MDHRVSPVMKIGQRRIQARDLEPRIGQALRPLDGIPIDLEVCSQAQFVRCAGQKDILQVDEAGLLAARREAQVRPGGAPSAVPIRHFEAKSARLLLASLADRNVYRGVGRVHPSLGNQPQRPARRHIVAQINLHIVIAGKPLILPASKGIQVVAIELADDFGHVGCLDHP